MFLFRTSSLWCWKHYLRTAACHNGAFRSIYVLTHYYVLTVSKELRVNFPEGKHLEALGKAGRLSRISWKITSKKGSWTMSKVEILMQLKIQIAQQWILLLPESKDLLYPIRLTNWRIILFYFLACPNTNQVIFRLHKINAFFIFWPLLTTIFVINLCHQQHFNAFDFIALVRRFQQQWQMNKSQRCQRIYLNEPTFTNKGGIF